MQQENNMHELVERLSRSHNLTDEELLCLLACREETVLLELQRAARKVRETVYGRDIYLRGLIEFTNYCRNDCYYCGIRAGNHHVRRYRLSEDEILSCCRSGYDLGFRTFVLQGGEDPYFDDQRMLRIIERIRTEFSDCAITLSLGEREYESYRRFFDAGADRYLLRHETASRAHYEKLHPASMSFDHRMQCLSDLKEIGYQVGCGFMVGSPYQTNEDLIRDLRFIQKLQPHMVGIGPFIKAKNTPFENQPSGRVEKTLLLLSIIRLLHPHVLLPATTALGTLDPAGREKGIMAGANVVMPNLSPTTVRKDYMLYDDKICTEDSAVQCRSCMETRMELVGCRIVTDRGDYIG